MKRLILIMAILTPLSFAQMNGKWVIDGSFRTYTDSLQYQTDVVASKDSVWILSFNWNPDAVRIYIKGNSNNPVDSIGVQFGYDVYNESGTVVATQYGSWTALKDSAWNTVSTIVNNTVGKDYAVYQFPSYGKLKFTLRNHRGTLTTRKAQITVQAWKND